ncbi:MAG TPA: UpxY family transcription antiterminator [Candidatus Coprenecus pullistercoris]|nr:UpxY family transcription antiterminator [Candidatus Coprenecus pullistercoris]
MSAAFCWWAMSAPYRRELKAKAVLDKLGIENFIPMRWQAVRKRDGTMSREFLPAIHNLIFVRASKADLQAVKQNLVWLQWLTRPVDGKNVPLTVPDKDMEQFIAVSSTCNEHLIYLRPDELDLRKGTKVRILGGPFNGMEGTFIKIRGARRKRVVIMLKDIIGVAMAEVTPDLLEVLDA